MNDKKRKNQPRRYLTDDEVVQMFLMRSEGKSVKDIAKLVGGTPSNTSRVLRREALTEVAIDPEIETKVLAMARPYGNRQPHKKVMATSQQEQVTAFTRFTTACWEIHHAEAECLGLGVDKELLSNTLMGITQQNHL